MLDGNVITNNGNHVANVAVVASTTTVATATGRIEYGHLHPDQPGAARRHQRNFRLVSRNFIQNFDLIPPPPVIQFAGAIASQGTITPERELLQPLLGPVGRGRHAGPRRLGRRHRRGLDRQPGERHPRRLGLRRPAITDPDPSASTTSPPSGTVDLAVMALPTPAVAKVGVPLEFQFLVTNRDPRFSTSPQVALDLGGLSGARSRRSPPARAASRRCPAGPISTPATWPPQLPLLLRRRWSGCPPASRPSSRWSSSPPVPGRSGSPSASSSPMDVDPDPANNLAVAGHSRRARPDGHQGHAPAGRRPDPVGPTGLRRPPDEVAGPGRPQLPADHDRQQRPDRHPFRHLQRQRRQDVTLRLARAGQAGATDPAGGRRPGSPGLTATDGSKLPAAPTRRPWAGG